ncbi:PAT complex subunit CCDC47-like isoform X1 [Clavelina lepadiformis]|uniref:PAT complex subunit CCDC47-like isoform X1 n=1 Tax=Clavelina lepadiformis TaxID=159417 RepID=UPI004040F6ED
MKLWVFVLILLLTTFGVNGDNRNQHGAEIEDNEFAEFEDFDEDVVELASEGDLPDKEEPQEVADDFQDLDEEDEDAVVETEEDEFESLDPDEFEGLPGDDTIWENENKKTKKQKKSSEPELKIADVPLHLRSWDKYYIEFLMGAGLLVYVVNFFIGRAKNNSIASTWLKSHVDHLNKQFELVGDDPSNKKAASTHQFVKESEHLYTLWCSGRTCCEGMLVELKLLKRQDLISVISDRLKPAVDQVVITITLTSMDPFVFCVGTKKSVANLHKNMQDVNSFCVEKSRGGEKYGLSSKLFVLSELFGELPNAILDNAVRKVLNENEGVFDSLLISDQFSGPLLTDQQEPTAKFPEAEKIISLTLNIPSENKERKIPNLLNLLKMALYLTDKVKKHRLSRENKMKTDKHRQEAMLKLMKQTHLQRQEAAQLKKEEKARALKDKMMNEEDPEKQRRMDEQIHRRELNKKNKKMMKGRQFKVKAM